MYRVYKNIDWIAFTMARNEIVPDWIVGTSIDKLERSPNRNYNVAMIGNTGCLIMIHTEQDNVGTHVILSGQTLGVLRGEGHADKDIASYADNKHVSRVDIAVTAENLNYYNEHLTPKRIQGMALSGEMQSRLHLDKGVDNKGKLETCYIGSRKSRNRIFRCYDKGVELGEAADRIIRYELETRKNANGIVRAITDGADIGGIIRRYVDFKDCNDWINIMSADSVVMPQLIEGYASIDDKIAIENANRWHWLFTSVAPALAKALYHDRVEIEDNDNLRLFGLHVQNLYNGLRGKNEKTE